MHYKNSIVLFVDPLRDQHAGKPHLASRCNRCVLSAELGAFGRHYAHRMKSRIMYVEQKTGGWSGPTRIGRVTFSKTGRTIYYRDRSFRSLKGLGFKANYYDVDTGDHFWISGPKRNGGDALYGGSTPIGIDDDVREEYWRNIRRQPERATA